MTALLDASEIAKTTVAELKEKLVALGLPTDGLKAALVKRLTDHVEGATTASPSTAVEDPAAESATDALESHDPTADVSKRAADASAADEPADTKRVRTEDDAPPVGPDDAPPPVGPDDAPPPADPPPAPNGGDGGGGPTRDTLQVPIEKIGLIIGKGGGTVQLIRHMSGASVQVSGETSATAERTVTLEARHAEQLGLARHLIRRKIDAAYAARDHPTFDKRVPLSEEHAGLVIGRGGTVIRQLQQHSGALVDLRDADEVPSDGVSHTNGLP